MQSSVLTAVFLPVALGIIMLGLGLSLTIADFKRVFLYPRAIVIGLVCQVLLLPMVAFALARAFALPPALAVGLMLLAASPGGATANLFSHLAKGDVALNITLTATNSIVSLFTLPIIVGFALESFMGAAQRVPLQPDKIVQVFAVVLVPVGIGMAIRARRAPLAVRLDKPVRLLSAVFLLLVILATVLKERANLAEYFRQVGVAALAFNLASMGLGFLVPRMFRLSRRQSTAISMEIGIHNGTLAIAVASTVLQNSVMAIPPAIYSLIMFFTAAAFAVLVQRKTTAEDPEPVAA